MRKHEPFLENGSPPAARAGRHYRLGLAASVGATALACAIALTATASARVGSRTATKPVLTIGLVAASSSSLDPAKQGNGPVNVQLDLSYAPITHWKPDGSIGPSLASSWRYLGSGNKNFEFTLRHDARFSDGTPVTAQAVKTWLAYCETANSPIASTIGPVRSIETVGKWVVRMHLRSPNPILPYALSDGYLWGFVASPKAVAHPAILGSQTFGAGPYVLVPSQSVSLDHYTYIPNKYYFNKAGIRYSKVVVKIISSASSMLAAARTGQVDVAFGDTSTADAAAAAGLTVVSAPTQADGLVFLDKSGTLSKPLSDVRVRQAMNYAVDRKAITSALLGKYGSPTSEWITLDGFDPKFQNYYRYDVAKAKSLLAAAGYPNGFTLNVLNGTFCGCVLVDPLTQAIAKYLDAIGVHLNLTTIASGSDWFAKAFGGTFPAFTVPRGGDTMWGFYGLWLKPGAALNQHGWDDPVLDKLWLKGQRAKNAPAFWRQMSQRMTTQADFLPVFLASEEYYVGKHVGGVSLTLRAPVAPMPTEWFPK
jgi:peptide/nickel transport system substrate-binding protein